MDIKKISGIGLLLLAAAMAYLGLKAGIMPPVLTAVGFALIGITFFTDKQKPA
jgi:hypothetical protein